MPIARSFAPSILVLLLAGSTAGAQGAAPASAMAAAAQRSPEELKAIGRKYAIWLLTARIDSLVAHAGTPEIAASTKSDGLEISVGIAGYAGAEVALIEERMVKRLKKDQYWRIANYSVLREPMLVRIVVNADGTYGGVGYNALSQAPPVDTPAN